MGTFHHDKGDLHGITVVVDTNGPTVFVGRCDTITPTGVILLDADQHEAVEGGTSKAQWVEKAAAYGVWARLPRIIVPTADVASVTRLGSM